MLRTRIIPCLLLRDRGLVKSVRFKDPTYVGDPVNVVRIFNDKEVDELILLDITRTTSGKPINFDLVGEIASECFMPVAYGGGIRTMDDIQKLFALGVEKVVLNTAAVTNIALVTEAARRYGAQSIVVALDVRRTRFGGYRVYSHCGTTKTALDPVRHARDVVEAGAGEVLVNSIDRDGTGSGYDLDLIRSVTAAVRVPVVASGGAGRLEDFAAAVAEGGASAVAAGSMFVFHGKHRAVLVSYPEYSQLEALFASR
jgi:cyclase